MGVTTLVFTGLIQVAALATSVVNGHGTTAVITACVAGRLAAVWACRLPAARPDGLGAWVAGSVSTLQAVSVTVLALGVPAALVAFDDDPAALPQTLAAVVLALVVAGLLQRWWRRRMGGITGDTIGAGVEVATTVALVVLATIR